MSKRTHSQMAENGPTATTRTVEEEQGYVPQQQQQSLVLEPHEERGIAAVEEEQQRKRRRATGTAGDAPFFDIEAALAALDDPYVLTKRQALTFLLTELQRSPRPLPPSAEALLCRRVRVEPDAGVKCMAVRCLVCLALAGSARPSVVAEELARQLGTANKDVRGAALAGLLDIYGRNLASVDDSTADGVGHRAAELLRSPHDVTRQKAILLLTALRTRRPEREPTPELNREPTTEGERQSASESEGEGESGSERKRKRDTTTQAKATAKGEREGEREGEAAHQRLLATYGSHDADPRVRAAALQCLTGLHASAVPLSLSLYEVATRALTDDFARVRLCAMELLVILANLRPDHMHDRGRGEMMRMADDGFIRVCAMVMDASAKVRATACRLLGKIGAVDTRYLVQAFSKEILGRSGRGRLAKSKSNTAAAAGDFDLSTSADVDLLGSGAGAFVLGLEDEFHEVRTAAIDSIRQLAAASLPFARVAVDFMVDMFNDEIDAVRSNAIHSLREMAEVVLLQEDQVHITLAVLHDTSSEIRWATYRLLAAIPLCNIQCTCSTVRALLAAMGRQPEDRLKVYAALAGVGARHGHFLEFLVEDLLQIDSHFLPVERSGDDVEYVGLLIALCNAAVANRNILALLPHYAARHYGFLKEQFPSLFPQSLSFATASLPTVARVWRERRSGDTESVSVSESVSADMNESEDDTTDTPEGMDRFFCSAWRRLLEAPPAPSAAAAQGTLLQKRATEVVQDLARKAHISPVLRVRAACYRALSSCLAAAFNPAISAADAGSLLQTTYEVENTYVGLTEATRGRLAALRALAHLRILAQTQSPPSCSLSGLKRRLAALAARPLPLELSSSVAAAAAAVSTGTPAELERAVHLLKPSPWALGGGDLCRVTAHTLTPVTNPEAPVIFHAEGELRLKFAAQLTNVPSGASLIILCKLPDYSTVVTPVSDADFEPTEQNGIHLVKELSIPVGQKHGWTEQCPVELQVARVYCPEVEADTAHFATREGDLAARRPMVALAPPTLVWAHAAEQSALKKLRHSRK